VDNFLFGKLRSQSLFRRAIRCVGPFANSCNIISIVLREFLELSFAAREVFSCGVLEQANLGLAFEFEPSSGKYLYAGICYF